MTNSLHSQTTPALPKKLLRGLLRQCAWCGGKGAFFTTWYTKTDNCQTCGLSRERGYEGFELGAATMGVFMTFGSIIAWMIISVATGIGLQQKIRQKVAAFNGHIIITNYDENQSQLSLTPISTHQDFYPKFTNIEGINHVQIKTLYQTGSPNRWIRNRIVMEQDSANGRT